MSEVKGLRRFFVAESVIFETSQSCSTWAQALRELADYIEGDSPEIPLDAPIPALTLDQRKQLVSAFDDTLSKGGRLLGTLSLNKAEVDPVTGLAVRIETGGK